MALSLVSLVKKKFPFLVAVVTGGVIVDVYFVSWDRATESSTRVTVTVKNVISDGQEMI